MRTIVFYDGDGGGWGGQLRSLLHAIAIAEHTDAKIVSFYPLIGRVFRLENKNLITADDLDSTDLKKIRDYIDHETPSHIEDKVHAMDIRSPYLLAAKHHMPDEVADEFHNMNLSGLSLPAFSRKTLSSLTLVDNGLRQYIQDRLVILGLHTRYGAIQVRSFFDSVDGNKLFNKRYALWIGWMLESLAILRDELGSDFPSKWLIISDNSNIAQKVSSIISKTLDIDAVSLMSHPMHTSVAFRLDRSLLTQRGSNILNQYWLDMVLLRAMYGDLAEWYLLANASVILTTGTSYAGTADSAMSSSYSLHYSICGDSVYCSSIRGPY